MRGTFRRDYKHGAGWHVQLSDESCDLADCRGLQDIHEALFYRWRDGDFDFDNAEAFEPIADNKAIEGVRRRISEANREQQAAYRCGDRAVADVLGLELVQLRKLDQQYHYRGRPKSFRSQAEREVDARREGVRRALEAIRKPCPGIADHLKSTLRFDGSFYRYAGEIDWNLKERPGVSAKILTGFVQRLNALDDYIQHGEDDRPRADEDPKECQWMWNEAASRREDRNEEIGGYVRKENPHE
jgi:hypothetical protein